MDIGKIYLETAVTNPPITDGTNPPLHVFRLFRLFDLFRLFCLFDLFALLPPLTLIPDPNGVSNPADAAGSANFGL